MGREGGGAVVLFYSDSWSIDSLQTLRPTSGLRGPGHTMLCPWGHKPAPQTPFPQHVHHGPDLSLTPATHKTHSSHQSPLREGWLPPFLCPVQPAPAIPSMWRQQWIVRMRAGLGASLPGFSVQVPLLPLTIRSRASSFL